MCSIFWFLYFVHFLWFFKDLYFYRWDMDYKMSWYRLICISSSSFQKFPLPCILSVLTVTYVHDGYRFTWGQIESQGECRSNTVMASDIAYFHILTSHSYFNFWDVSAHLKYPLLTELPDFLVFIYFNFNNNPLLNIFLSKVFFYILCMYNFLILCNLIYQSIPRGEHTNWLSNTQWYLGSHIFCCCFFSTSVKKGPNILHGIGCNL